MSFHDTVLSLRPKNQKTKSTTYWVAVLKSVVLTAVNDYQEEDFLWIKCHGSISVKTIYEQYTAKHPEEGEIKLKLGSKVPSDTTPMRDLDEFNDRLIVFEPFRGSDPPVRASVERVPLQPIKHQATVKPDPDELSSKIPPTIPKHQIPTPASQDENIRPAHISSRRSLPAVVAQSHPYSQPRTKQSTRNHLMLRRLRPAQQQHIWLQRHQWPPLILFLQRLTQAHRWRRQILLNTLHRLPRSGRYLRDSKSLLIKTK